MYVFLEADMDKAAPPCGPAVILTWYQLSSSQTADGSQGHRNGPELRIAVAAEGISRCGAERKGLGMLLSAPCIIFLNWVLSIVLRGNLIPRFCVHAVCKETC